MDQHKTDGATSAALGLKAFAGGAFTWLVGVHPVYWTFVGLMVIDFITGVWAAGKAGKVDSARSREGMQRKTVQLLLVLASEFLYRTLQTTLKQNAGMELPAIPAGAIVAGFYCAHEFISIVENAGRMGVFIPRPIRVALKKLNELEDGDGKGG